MRAKAVILNLRVARGTDFSDELGQKKYGCMYFQQSIDGSFCNQPYFFHDNTNLEVFRELYNSNQIWVLAGIFDEVEIIDKRKPILKNVRSSSKKSNRKIIRIGNGNSKFNGITERPCTCKHKQPNK